MPPRFCLQGCLGFTTYLGSTCEGPLFEIVSRIATGFIENVGQHICSVSRESLARDPVFSQPLDKDLVCFFELSGSFGVRMCAVESSRMIALDPFLIP